VRFQYLKENQERYNIRKACKNLKVSRTGYYAHINKKRTKLEIEDELLSARIEHIFYEHKGCYGAKRISESLKREDLHASRRRVGKLMKKKGLYAKRTRYYYKNYLKKAKNEERPNLLNQIFKAKKKNEIWLGDISYIQTKHVYLYLVAFIDVYTRRVVGWSTATTLKEDLVMQGFLQAYGREKPKEGLIVHTDQGSQFTGKSFRSMLQKYGSVTSNSRRGNPYDNAMMESFYRKLKTELLQEKAFETTEEAQQEIFKYIELYYNKKRMHSALGYLSPAEYDKAQNVSQN